MFLLGLALVARSRPFHNQRRPRTVHKDATEQKASFFQIDEATLKHHLLEAANDQAASARREPVDLRSLSCLA